MVTGGSSGIGKATSQLFAREGAKVVIADIDVGGGEETVQLIKGIGGEAIFFKTDVTKAAEVKAMVDKVVEKYGRLDCAFNNSGTEGLEAPIVKDTEENWDRVINTNLKGVWLCMKYEITYMAEHGGGAIVNNSAVSGYTGFDRCMSYVASKHGIIGMTKSATLEYASLGIRINAVCPGSIRTPMTDRIGNRDPRRITDTGHAIPIGRMGTPEDIAKAVVWLCSDEASFITGDAITIDGGYLAGHFYKQD